MTGERTEIPQWAAGVEGMPATGLVRVLGRIDGNVHVVAAEGRAGMRLVAKRCASGSAPEVTRVMRALHAALPPAAPLAIPSVLGCDDRRTVLVQCAAPGCPMLASLSDASHRRAALRMAARALACLHESPVTHGRIVSLSDHLRDLVRPHPAAAADELGDLGQRLAVVSECLVQRSRHNFIARVVPIHRDVHARQMLLDGDRVWLLDWDLFARGDAALDVANFAVYLRTHLTKGDAAAAAFLEAYAAAREDVAPRLALYIAFTYVRLACKAFRLKPPGWRQRVEVCVSLAESRLDGGLCHSPF